MNAAGKKRCEELQNLPKTQADLQQQITLSRMMGLLCHCSAEIDQGALLFFSVHNMYLGSGDYLLLLFSEISGASEEQKSGLDVYGRMMVYHLIEEEVLREFEGHMTINISELDGRLAALIQFQYGLLPEVREGLQEQIEKSCCRIAGSCREKYDIQVVTYISAVMNQISVISSTYHKMLSMATLHRYTGRTFEVPYYRLYRPDAESASPIRFPVRENAWAIAHAITEEEDYPAVIRNILSEMAAQAFESVEELKRFHGMLFEAFCEEIQLRGIRLNAERLQKEERRRVMESTDWADLIDFFTETADQIALTCRNEQQTSLQRHLSRVQDYIRENLTDPELCLKSISDACGISTTGISVMFRHQVKVTPARYIRLQRLTLSRSLLQETELSIEEIANRCGFGSLATFHRIFKTEYGITPGRFRRLSASAAEEP